MNDNQKKRLAVVRDALKQLNAKTIVPTNEGNYFVIDREIAATLKPSDDMSEVIQGQTCKVCALGALFVGHLNKYDGVSAEDALLGIVNYAPHYVRNHMSRHAATEPLREYFSSEQLDLIECAFEGRSVTFNSNIPNEIDAVKFYGRYKTSAGRLRGILQNILDNRGEFVP